MRFAENNRISQRQLYRQMILAFAAPFLVCLFGQRKLLGIGGILGTAAAIGILFFYVVFLIRLGNCCADLKKSAGVFWGRLFGMVFLFYVILTGAYLLQVLEEIVPVSLLTGISGRWISFAAIVVCSLGASRGMQKRGRMAEVSGGILLFGILFMMILSLGQSRLSYLQEMTTASWDGKDVLRSIYGILCAFSGIGLLPFLMEHVEHRTKTGKTVRYGILTLGGLIFGMLLLLPAVFGWERLKKETYPVLPLLAGADLPGNVLARFDVLWLAFLLYSLLFAIGSLLHYGHQILQKSHMGNGRFWLPALMYGVIFLEWEGSGIREYYGLYLAYIHVPVMLLVQTVLFFKGKGKRKKRLAAAAAACMVPFFFTGCAGIEPEKRLYPLALGVSWAEEQFSVSYGMPDLPSATGQEKPEEGEKSSFLKLEGKDFQEIEKEYNRSQEKYLDMGHLEVLILGDTLLEEQRWETVLSYLEKETFVGENLYVFRAEKPEEILSWEHTNGSSVGEYLIGILENRTAGQQKKGVTLRQVYHKWYEDREIMEIPEVKLWEDRIEILFVQE